MESTEIRKQRLWTKLGAVVSLLFALICFTGVIQSVLLLKLSNEPQPTAFRNMIISGAGLLISFAAFIFFALAFRKATKNPLVYNQRREE